ncbi:hypothetical protein [Streptomyces canus]|uniref:hypothetical protein n=1 Tax=Streptomyces canus TaxID=58343 RepID=UPI002E268BB7
MYQLRRGISAIAAFTAALTASLFQPVQAQAADCGTWTPGAGSLTVQYTDSSAGHTFKELVVRTAFTFSRSEITALRCTGSRSLEVDAETYGGVKNGIKSYRSNLPNAYLDTEYDDRGPGRTLTVGTSSAAQLQPDHEYVTELHVREISTPQNYAEVYLNFQRGHWARKSSPKEATSCLGHGGSDPAWCVFADKTAKMTSRMGGPVRIAFPSRASSSLTAAWGRLLPGQRLNPGDRLASPNGLNVLVLQTDGNLVEYIPGGRAIWATNTRVSNSVLFMQADGNLVVVAPGNRPVWASATSGKPGSILELQDDRNLVVYAPGHVAVWANNIAGRP